VVMPKKSSSQKRKNTTTKYPNISRSFPATTLFVLNKKLFLIHSLSVFLFVALIIVGIDMYSNMQKKQDLFSVRKRVEIEKMYWEKITTIHKNYRDGYYKLALLEYTLGNSDRAMRYVTQALQVDPNFLPGKVFAEKIVKQKD